MAASGEVEYNSRPGTSNVRYSYWSQLDSVGGPKLQHSKRPRSQSYDATMNDPAADFNLLPVPDWKQEHKLPEQCEPTVCMCIYVHMYVHMCTCIVHIHCVYEYMYMHVLVKV